MSEVEVDCSKLMDAIHRNNLSDIRRLLDAGCDVNHVGKTGTTVLMDAVADGVLPDTTSLLLMYGADVNAANPDGETPLIAVARSEFGDEQNIALLLTHGADIHARDHRGATALFGAEAHVIDVLMEAGADVDAQDWAGNTALMRVCKVGAEPEVKALLEYHANANLRNHDGTTALWFAQNEGLQWLTRIRQDNSAWTIEK